MPGKIKTSVLEIAYEEHGERSAPPVILLHGFPDDARTWDAIAPALAGKGFRTLAPFLRGFGATRFLSKKTPRSGQVTALAQDLIEFADALGIDRFILVGHDWGAQTGYAVAALFPERVRALVTLAVGHMSGAPAVDAKQPLSIEQIKAYWYQWHFNMDKGREVLESDRSEFCRALWKIWSPSWQHHKTTFDKTAASFANPDFVNIVTHSYRYRWGNAPGDPRYDELVSRLAKSPKIIVPTTLLVGAEDGAALAKSSEGKEEHFAGEYKRQVLRGVGHFIQRENPEAVIKAVREIAKLKV
jgi:pimeloyl-ACP methyl ester carboxylesterase